MPIAVSVLLYAFGVLCFVPMLVRGQKSLGDAFLVFLACAVNVGCATANLTSDARFVRITVGGWTCVVGFCTLIIFGFAVLTRLEDGPHGAPIWAILLSLLATGLFSALGVLQLVHAA